MIPFAPSPTLRIQVCSPMATQTGTLTPGSADQFAPTGSGRMSSAAMVAARHCLLDFDRIIATSKLRKLIEMLNQSRASTTYAIYTLEGESDNHYPAVTTAAEHAQIHVLLISFVLIGTREAGAHLRANHCTDSATVCTSKREC